MEQYAFDAAYLERLSAGDGAVERHFYAYFGELILIRSRSRRLASDVIDDIRQETFVRVLQAVRRGTIREPDRLGSFVLKTCNNITMEMNRSGSRFTPMDANLQEPLDQAADAERELVSSQQRDEVRSVLADMPSRQRKLLTAILEERTSLEICTEHRVDADYLRVLLFRARKKFQELLERRRQNGGKK